MRRVLIFTLILSLLLSFTFYWNLTTWSTEEILNSSAVDISLVDFTIDIFEVPFNASSDPEILPYSNMYEKSIQFVNRKMLDKLPVDTLKKWSLIQAHNFLDINGTKYMINIKQFPYNLANTGRWGNFTDFISNELWLEYNLTTPTLAIGNKLEASRVGNVLSSFFQEMAFANNHGMDFLSVGRYPCWEYHALNEKEKESIRISLLDFLPWYRAHDAGKVFNKEEAVKDAVTCSGWNGFYPHVCSKNQFQHFAPQSRAILQSALKDFHEFYGKDMIESEVAMHFRCGDVYATDNDEYGVLARSYYKHAIPKDVKKISISAQPQKDRAYCDMRATDCIQFTLDLCAGFLHTTIDFLKEDFPGVEITVYDNDTVTETFTRLANSQVLVCSLSTFCFWAGVASSGQVLFPQEKRLVNLEDWTVYGDSFKFVEGAIHLQPTHFNKVLAANYTEAFKFITEN